jgi:hypothetical protein
LNAAEDPLPGKPFRARFEMALTPADFQRLSRYLPQGTGNVRFAPASVHYEEAGRCWEVRMGNPRTRSYAAGLFLPVADIEIEMTGYSASEAERFVERFHLVFRRGGG